MVNSKQKGKRGEQELARYLREAGFEVTRNWFAQTVEKGHSDIIGIDGWSIECKRAANATRIKDWWIQTVDAAAIEQGKTGKLSRPVLIYRLDRAAWRVRICICAIDTALHGQIELDLPTWVRLVDRLDAES